MVGGAGLSPKEGTLKKERPDEDDVLEALARFEGIEEGAFIEAVRRHVVALTEGYGNDLDTGATSISNCPPDGPDMVLIVAEHLGHMLQAAVDFVIDATAPSMPGSARAKVIMAVVEDVTMASKAWGIVEAMVADKDADLPEDLADALGKVVA